MAAIQYRVSRGKKYWSIVESRRVNGKPRTFILAYLGTAKTLLDRLNSNEKFSIKSYSHGDTMALLTAAIELDVINIINKHIPANKLGIKPKRDGLTVGATFLLAAIGRACHPTSKLAWYDWCKDTSLEYCLKTQFKKLDSQHFWDQMEFLPIEAIHKIEEELVLNLIKLQGLKLDCLFFDTTNFFTFIDTTNNRCELPKRGRNKQKRFDLRQIGLALLVSKEEQFPLFHQTYRGNKNDVTVFKENCGNLLERLRHITKEVSDVTLVFDKGNNSKENFAKLNQTPDCYYVAGLVPAHFKSLIKEANQHFSEINIEEEVLPAYRIKKDIWKQELTCVVTISSQLKEGQIQGILQHLDKKYKALNEFKQQLENPNARKKFTKTEIKERLQNIIRGQFIEEILLHEIIELEKSKLSFTYSIDAKAFEKLKKDILGRKIVATNRHEWSSEEILLAYRGQAKVEYAFRNLKNPYHMAIRPQYHWTDQKIEAHFLMCIIGYLLTVYVYKKVKPHYSKNISQLMDELKKIRLGCIARGNKITYQLEEISKPIQKIAKKLNISNETVRPKTNFSDYI
ncbi:MAG: IS1634 family transposase [Bacteroidota bacterium]